jgi:hypothetical protein
VLKFLFADDQVIISTTEDYSQKTGCKLNQIITEHGLTISAQKKPYGIIRRDPVTKENCKTTKLWKE